MFLHLSLILFTEGLCIPALNGGGYISLDTALWADTPPRQILPLGRHPLDTPRQTPPGRHPHPWADIPTLGQTTLREIPHPAMATEAGGTRPTGMHFCFNHLISTLVFKAIKGN